MSWLLVLRVAFLFCRKKTGKKKDITHGDTLDSSIVAKNTKTANNLLLIGLLPEKAEEFKTRKKHSISIASGYFTPELFCYGKEIKKEHEREIISRSYP